MKTSKDASALTGVGALAWILLVIGEGASKALIAGCQKGTVMLFGHGIDTGYSLRYAFIATFFAEVIWVLTAVLGVWALMRRRKECHMAQVILVPKGKRLRVFLIGINTFLVTFTGWFTFLHFQKTSVMLWTASFAMTIFVAWVIDRRNSPKDISWERDGVIIVLLLGSSVAFTFNLIWNNGFQFWMFWPLANAMLTVWNRSIQRRISLVNQSDVERAIVVLQTGLVGFAVALIGSYLTFGEHFYPSQINLNPQFLRYILIAGLCSTMVPITRMFAGAEPKATVTNQQIIMLFSSFVFGFGISIVYGEPVYGTSLGTLLIMAVTVVIYLTKWSRPSDR